MKNNVVNTDMSDFWNGDGGRNWMRFQHRLAISLKHFGQQAMVATNLSKGEKVLDIGCGWGDTTFDIARTVASNGYVQGVDISDLILQHAITRLKSSDLDNVSFKCVDAESHRFTLKSFDVAYSRFGVMFFNDPVAAFNNIRQILKPNGRLSFICWQPIADNQWVKLPLDSVAKHFVDAPEINEDLPGAFSLGDKSKASRILESAGYNNISIEPFKTKLNVGNSIEEAIAFLSNLGPASGVFGNPDIDIDTKNHILNDLRKELNHNQSTEGVELNASTWIVNATTV